MGLLAVLVDALPERLWRVGNLYQLPGGDWHFCIARRTRDTGRRAHGRMARADSCARSSFHRPDRTIGLEVALGRSTRVHPALRLGVDLTDRPALSEVIRAVC